MNVTNTLTRNNGIGLIEVLIATVVVAVGLLAISSLQINLISGSSNNKIRSEAMLLANLKLEELKDRIEKEDSFDEIASGKETNWIVGSNENFARYWLVTDQTNPERKVVEVKVAWGATGQMVLNAANAAAANAAANSSASIANEQVIVQSVISFQSPGASMLAASDDERGLNAMSPSPSAESSDKIFDDLNVPLDDLTLFDAERGIYTREINGETQYFKENDMGGGDRVFLCSDLVYFENNLYTRRVNDDSIAGDESIELFSDNNDGLSCTRQIRFNGGIIIPIRGIVYSRATSGNNPNAGLLDVNLFTFNASESGAYCVFNPTPNSTEAPYVCYVGGNCINGPDGVHLPRVDADTPPQLATTGQHTAVTECPKPAVAQIKVGPGGWRGNVGLLGIASNGNNVCFAEELAGPSSTINTARAYYTRRTNGNIVSNEGINKPYDCHNFLIINGKNTLTQISNECKARAATISGLKLASKYIQRNLTGTTPNSVDLITDVSYCPGDTAPTILVSGEITNASTAPTVTITDGVQSPVECQATSTAYSCTITTNETELTVNATSGSLVATCIMAPSTVGCTLNLATPTLTTYNITGNIIGGRREEVVIELAGTPCTIDHTNAPSIYTCSIQTTANIATLTASGGGVTPSSVSVQLTPGASDPTTVEGPNFNAIIPRTISGTISFTNQVTIAQASISVLEGNCGPAINPTGSQSYSCTVPDGVENTLTITISPPCSTGNNSRKYQITQGTNSSLGTGTLAIPLGTVTGNQTRDISVSRSNTNC